MLPQCSLLLSPYSHRAPLRFLGARLLRPFGSLTAPFEAAVLFFLMENGNSES